MPGIKHLAAIIMLTFSTALWSTARAQTLALDVAIDTDQVRFAAAAQEMRVEVYAPSGEMIFDSGAITDQSIEWKMQDQKGERVADGVYLVTIQLKSSSGQVRKRIEQVVVGGEQQRRSAVQQSPNAVQSTITGSGATGRIAKFTNTTVIGSSVMTENSGKIGIGITTPTALLHVKSTTSDLAITGVSTGGDGVLGQTASTSAAGVHGVSTATNGTGVFGEANNGTGSTGVFGRSAKGYGVAGGSTSGIGVQGTSNSGKGVSGMSNTGAGVFGFSSSGEAILGQSFDHTAIHGISSNGDGVNGSSDSNSGVFGNSDNGDGVDGSSNSGDGVSGLSDTGDGVSGVSFGSGDGVRGTSASGEGVAGTSGSKDGDGVFGSNFNLGGNAGYFQGNVQITNMLTKGGGSFKIDDPLDPANKYLYHSFVESPDMMNIYNGNITLDQNGEAVVTMPRWFNALNRDFRYQLTAIGAPGPNLYIAEEVKGNHFKIAGGTPGMRVSWQVTGIRKDAWADAHRIPVEEEKPERERGFYLHPELFHQPEEKGVTWALHPELMRRMRDRATEPQSAPRK